MLKLAVSGVGNRMKNVLLRLLIWFSCTTLRKRDSTVPVKMTGVHLTYLLCAPGQKGDTCIHVSGFLAEWSKSKKVLKSLKLDMQFLDHHRTQFLELHADLSKIEYSPQSEAALTKFKALLLLEIALLCAAEWRGRAGGGGGPEDGGGGRAARLHRLLRPHRR